MKKGIITIVMFSMLLVGCVNASNLVSDFSGKLTVDSLDDEKLSSYGLKVSLSHDEEESTDTHFKYNVYVVPNEEFKNAPDNEQLDLAKYIGEFINSYTDSSQNISLLTDCFSKDINCTINKIQVEGSDIFYEYDFSDFVHDENFDIKAGKNRVNYETISSSSSFSKASSNTDSSTASSSTPSLALEETGCTVDGSFIKTTGFIKNNGSESVTFVRVQVTYLDESGGVVDTDWTYAVDSQPLNSDDRRSYEILSNKNDQIKNCNQKVTEYQ